jgi:hypothetical protein
MLIDLCVCADRILLTKDRQLALGARDTVRVLLLAHRSIDGNARELREVFDIHRLLVLSYANVSALWRASEHRVVARVSFPSSVGGRFMAVLLLLAN